MIKQGIVDGLAVMFCWGLADFIQSIPIRRIGTPRTMFIRNVLTVLLVFPITIFLYVDNQLAIHPLQLLIIILGSLLYVLGYYMFMRGFEVGNVSLVAPIAGSFSAMTVLLALVFLNESMSTFNLAAVFSMIAGVFLTSIDIRKIKNFRSQKGLKEALCAMTGFGLSFFVLGFISKQLDALNIFIFTTLSQALLFIVISVSKGGVVKKKDISLKLFWIFIVHSLFVNLGWFAYIYGVGKALVSLVTPISSLFPGITVLLAILFYKEQLVPNQKVGIVGILVGVLLINI